MLLLALACTPKEPTPPPVVVEPTRPAPPTWVDTGLYRPPDTGDVALGDDVPANDVQIEHRGHLERSGTPYDAAVGMLHVVERLNGYQPDTSDTGDVLACDVQWFVNGTPETSMATCAGCGPVWTLTFTVDPASEGSIGACLDNELPADGEIWRMGFDPASSTVFLDVANTGIWLPWWTGIETADRIDLSWDGELSVDVGEEE